MSGKYILQGVTQTRLTGTILYQEKSILSLNPFVVFWKHISFESITSVLLFAINAFRPCKAIWCLSDYVLSLFFSIAFLLLPVKMLFSKCAYFLHSVFTWNSHVFLLKTEILAWKILQPFFTCIHGCWVMDIRQMGYSLKRNGCKKWLFALLKCKYLTLNSKNHFLSKMETIFFLIFFCNRTLLLFAGSKVAALSLSLWDQTFL